MISVKGAIMKLDIKKTAFIGLGFMTIMMLWQVYNYMVPIYLDDFLTGIFNFEGAELVIGIVMALDNLFALFMIPLMSYFSDKTKTRIGRRMPYIIVGIISAAVAFVFLPFTKNVSIWLLIANILLVLVCMNIYRSPCVALMPDVTPKPLRSKANSIINIMGGCGIAVGYISIILFGNNGSGIIPFFIVSGMMLLILAIMLVKVNEVKLVGEFNEYKAAHPEEDDTEEETEKGTLAKANRKNVWLILMTVFFIYMSTNAVETFISLYSQYVFEDLKMGAIAIIPFGIASFIFAVPGALLASKFGRKATIISGAALMMLSYIFIAFFGAFSWWILVGFFIAGVGFAFIVTNIYPMVVDNCDAANTGKYTGYYYTASMLAQSLTPALSGLAISRLVFNSYRVLFPYAFVFIACAIITLLFVRKNKNDKA